MILERSKSCCKTKLEIPFFGKVAANVTCKTKNRWTFGLQQPFDHSISVQVSELKTWEKAERNEGKYLRSFRLLPITWAHVYVTTVSHKDGVSFTNNNLVHRCLQLTLDHLSLNRLLNLPNDSGVLEVEKKAIPVEVYLAWRGQWTTQL